MYVYFNTYIRVFVCICMLYLNYYHTWRIIIVFFIGKRETVFKLHWFLAATTIMPSDGSWQVCCHQLCPRVLWFNLMHYCTLDQNPETFLLHFFPDQTLDNIICSVPTCLPLPKYTIIPDFATECTNCPIEIVMQAQPQTKASISSTR